MNGKLYVQHRFDGKQQSECAALVRWCVVATENYWTGIGPVVCFRSCCSCLLSGFFLYMFTLFLAERDATELDGGLNGVC